MRKGIVLILLVLIIGAVWYLLSLNDFQQDGELKFKGLTASVRVVRDENGIPYIFAQNMPDLLRAQGFITAQDRLFQILFYRRIINSRLSETIGEKGLSSDIMMHLLELKDNANRHAKRLSPETKAFIEPFVEGINTYIKECTDEHSVEVKFSGDIKTPWSLADVISFVHFVSLSNSTNMFDELLSQQLIDTLGFEKASELFPLNVNADNTMHERIGLKFSDLLISSHTLSGLNLGSNNWVVAPQKSSSGGAILVSDPHVNANMLPGVWHPVGLFCPEVRAIGFTLAGLPGIMIGRTDWVAFGITNAYGDVQDVYIETTDPENPNLYQNGDTWEPFKIRKKTILVRDPNAQGKIRKKTVNLRYTERGPVITDHGLGPAGNKVLSLRWIEADESTWGPQLGIDKLLLAQNVQEVDEAVQHIDLWMFNYVFADIEGNIGFRASGKIPRRAGGNGSYPKPASNKNDWIGWIPKNEMPAKFNPKKKWIGTANHDTRPIKYPYYYSSHFAPSYRYRRIIELLNNSEKTSVEDHWQYMRDTRNLQAKRLVPHILTALKNRREFEDFYRTLSGWDFLDQAETSAPLVYQSIYRHLTRHVFEDELGKDLTTRFLDARYYWQERFDAMVNQGKSNWFDDKKTDTVEGLEDMIVLASRDAKKELEQTFGADAAKWRWGDAHKVLFVSPLRQNGFGRDWLGAGEFPMHGSDATLFRANYNFSKPYKVNYFDSARLVADLADSEKILAVIAGGITDRHFQPHFKSMIQPWYKGTIVYWWFSDEAINLHAKHELILHP